MAVLTTAQARAAWGPACQPDRGVTLDLNGTGRVYVDRRITDAVRALNACLVAFHYLTRRADTGAYNCRRITGGTLPSLHAYLIALDINWTSNPYSTVLRTDMPAGMVGAITAIRTMSGAVVWRWGGAYTGRHKDAMHYEVVCTPAELATGIDWTTVPGYTPAKVPYAWVPEVLLHPGSHDPAVARAQLALELLRPLTAGPHLAITTPPGYGKVTVEAVHDLQTFARRQQLLAGHTRPHDLLDVDGIWGPATARTAKFWLPSASAVAKAAA